MWSGVVVVDPPYVDDRAGMGVAGEQMLIQALVSQPAVE